MNTLDLRERKHMKKQKNTRLYNGVFLGGLAILVLGGFFMFASNKKQYNEQLALYKELEEQHTVARLELEGEKRMLEYAKSDEYTERVVRKMFKWSRDGEIVFQDVASSSAANLNPGPTITDMSEDENS